MDYAAMADDLREFFANENISRGHLLGHSMGGKVAMQFTADNSQSVIKLVVVDIAPKEYPPMHMPVLAALRGLHLADYTSFGDIDRALERQIPEAPLRQFLLKNLARRTDQRFYWHIGLDEIIAGYNDLNRAVAINRTVANPACFIRAGRSGYIADADVPAIHAMFPNAQIVTFAESSHWVHIDVAQEFYESVTEFLLDTLR
jgi:pimeloyl-ACP methyl ester carboxylesterase